MVGAEIMDDFSHKVLEPITDIERLSLVCA